MRWILLGPLALGFVGCISDNSAPPATGGGDDAGVGDAVGGDPAPAGDPVDWCATLTDIATFVPTEERYKTKYDDERDAQRIMYKGQDSGATFGAPAALRVLSYEGLPSYPETSGTVYDLSTLNPDGGPGFLVKLDVDCDDKGRFCTVETVGYAGQATVSSIDWTTPIGSTYAGSLANIELHQVEYDVNDLPVMVAGGCSFELTAFSWSGTVSEGTGD